MKIRGILGSLLLAAAIAMALFAVIPSTQAVDCNAYFTGNALVTGCDATPGLNTFGTSGDHWGIYGRDLGTGGFSLYDDSAGSFPPDTLGVIKTGYTEAFFAAEDLQNGDNSAGGGTLDIVFDVSGLGTLQTIAIDLGAMGDFEAVDNEYTFTYQLDSGPATTVFTITTDESVDPYTYTLESGTEVGLDDPLILAPTGSCADTDYIDNDLQTCTANISGSGSVLTLTLEAATANGGSEVFVFDKILITGTNGDANAVVINRARVASSGLPLFASALLLAAGLVVLRKRK